MKTTRGLALAAALVVGAAGCGGDDGEAAAVTCEVDQVDGDLAIFNWSEYIDPEQLAEFESTYDVSVTMDTFESNEAMQPVVSAGNSGYDLIVPSGYMVEIMREGGFLLALDADALPNLSNLSAEFADPAYDPGSAYSAAYQWGYTGLAVDTEAVGDDVARSWDLVFGEEADAYAGRITLLNDPREAIGAALKSLGHSLNTTDQAELDEATELLAATTSRLAAYNTDSAGELLVGGETVIAQAYSGDAFVDFLEADDPSRYVFFVPEEGGARWVDTMAIPFDAPHPCTAHTFINWLLDGEQGAALSNWNYYATPNEAALDGLDDELREFLDSGLIAGDDAGVEDLLDTGDFEVNYSDAFTEARG